MPSPNVLGRILGESLMDGLIAPVDNRANQVERLNVLLVGLCEECEAIGGARLEVEGGQVLDLDHALIGDLEDAEGPRAVALLDVEVEVALVVHF